VAAARCCLSFRPHSAAARAAPPPRRDSWPSASSRRPNQSGQDARARPRSGEDRRSPRPEGLARRRAASVPPDRAHAQHRRHPFCGGNDDDADVNRGRGPGSRGRRADGDADRRRSRDDRQPDPARTPAAGAAGRPGGRRKPRAQPGTDRRSAPVHRPGVSPANDRREGDAMTQRAPAGAARRSPHTRPVRSNR
jgi:hypothetical protein